MLAGGLEFTRDSEGAEVSLWFCSGGGGAVA